MEDIITPEDAVWEMEHLTELKLKRMAKRNAKIISELRAKGYRYVTRSKSGEVVAHRIEPKRESNFWFSDYFQRPVEGIVFTELYWRDEPFKLRKKVVRKNVSNFR